MNALGQLKTGAQAAAKLKLVKNTGKKAGKVGSTIRAKTGAQLGGITGRRIGSATNKGNTRKKQSSLAKAKNIASKDTSQVVKKIAQKVAGKGGQAAGAAIGGTLLPGVGATAGSFIGKQFGEHPIRSTIILICLLAMPILLLLFKFLFLASAAMIVVNYFFG